MLEILENFSRKEKRLLKDFNRFENRHKMAPSYSSNDDLLKERDNKTTLMAYKKLIDAIEPEPLIGHKNQRSFKEDYVPMDLISTNQKDYVPHNIKPMQQLIESQKLQNYALNSLLRNEALPLLNGNKLDGTEYEWVMIERNPTKYDNHQDEKIESLYSRDFKAHTRNHSRRRMRQDCLQIRPGSEKIESKTSYSKDFVQHQVPVYYQLPRNDDDDPTPLNRARYIKTDKRYFTPNELRLLRGYYNPFFNLDNVILVEQNQKHNLVNQPYPSHNQKYETLKPKFERSKSLHFDRMKTTDERSSMNKNVKYRIFETLYQLKSK